MGYRPWGREEMGTTEHARKTWSVLRVSPVGKKRRKINFWGNAVDDVGSCGRQKRKGKNRKLKRER